MRKTLLTLLVFTTILAACKKQDTTNGLPPAPVAKIAISGFTQTDANGKLIGTIDYTDWTNDASWNADEMALFAFADSANLTGTDTCRIAMQPAYPNGVTLNDTITLKISTTNKVALSIVVVDQYLVPYTKPVSFTTTNAGAILPIAISKGTYISGNSYRIYYAMSALSHKLFYKGHGDFKVN